MRIIILDPVNPFLTNAFKICRVDTVLPLINYFIDELDAALHWWREAHYH